MKGLSIFRTVFKRIRIQFLKVQEFRQRHVESNRQFVQRPYAGILGYAANDIVQRGLTNVAHGGQLIDCDAAACAQLPNAANVNVMIFHEITLIMK